MKDNPFDWYVCPKCKEELQPLADRLNCATCGRDYPIVSCIPDFLLVRPQESRNPFLDDIEKLGRWARLYDTPLWYPLVPTCMPGSVCFLSTRYWLMCARPSRPLKDW